MDDDLKFIFCVVLSCFVICTFVGGCSLIQEDMTNDRYIEEAKIRTNGDITQAIETGNRNIVEKCYWEDSRTEQVCNDLAKELGVKK